MELFVSIAVSIVFAVITMNVLIEMFKLNELPDSGAKLFVRIFSVVFLVVQMLFMTVVLILFTLLLYDSLVLDSKNPKLGLYLFVVLSGIMNLRLNSVVTLVTKYSIGGSFTLHKKLIQEGCELFNTIFRALVFLFATVIAFIVNLAPVIGIDSDVFNVLTVNPEVINYGITTLLAFDMSIDGLTKIPVKLKGIFTRLFT